MQIHIWQQFSSNHSADFTVVGEFDSPETARTAAETLRDMIQYIVEWHFANPDAYPFKLEAAENMPPSPAEQALAQQYGIEWHDYHEWLKLDPIVDDEWEIYLNSVVSLDKFVFINNARPTAAPFSPFADVINRLGGRAHYETDAGYGKMILNLTCAAPDPQTAQSLRDDLEGQYMDEDAVVFEATEAKMPWGWEMARPFELDDILVNGTQLHFKDMWFSLAMKNGLTTLISWLKDHDCEDIHFTVTQAEKDNQWTFQMAADPPSPSGDSSPPTVQIPNTPLLSRLWASLKRLLKRS